MPAVALDLILGPAEGAAGHGRNDGNLVSVFDLGVLPLQGADVAVVDEDGHVLRDVAADVEHQALERGVALSEVRQHLVYIGAGALDLGPIAGCRAEGTGYEDVYGHWSLPIVSDE